MTEQGPAGRRETVTVRVFAPNELEPKEFTFPKDETVGRAAEIAAQAFGLHPTAPSFLLPHEKEPVDPSKTLEAAGVHDGEKLELVDVGGGV